MKPLLSLCLLFVACGLSAQATAQKNDGRWVPGVRAGMLIVPYGGTIPSVASGAMLGGELSRILSRGTRLTLTVDFAKVSNLQAQEQEAYTGVLANEAIRYTSIRQMNGYSALRFGAEVEPGFLRGKRLGISLHNYFSVVTNARGQNQTTAFAINYDVDVTETSESGTFGSGSRASEKLPLTAEDHGVFVLSIGPSLNYRFRSGPRISIATQFDLSPRILIGADSDPYLNHLQFSFSYPLFSL